MCTNAPFNILYKHLGYNILPLLWGSWAELKDCTQCLCTASASKILLPWPRLETTKFPFPDMSGLSNKLRRWFLPGNDSSFAWQTEPANLGCFYFHSNSFSSSKPLNVPASWFWFRSLNGSPVSHSLLDASLLFKSTQETDNLRSQFLQTDWKYTGSWNGNILFLFYNSFEVAVTKVNQPFCSLRIICTLQIKAQNNVGGGGNVPNSCIIWWRISA